jgi:serine protease Do
MRKRITIILVGAVAIGLQVARSTSAQEFSPNQIYAHAAPAVVFIAGYGPGVKGMGGTGSIIDASGLVLTNAHVVIEEESRRPYSQVTVYLKPDRVTGIQEKDLSRRLKARVLAFDRALDLALLKVEAPPPLTALSLGDPDQVQIGDRVVAIGHPEQGGLWTLTTGVISAEFLDFQKIPGKDVFQTEASFNRGNSGGPLLDGYGHLVGVNTSIARQAADGMAIVSINFALKSSVAQIWLKKQGVQVVYAGRSGGQPAGANVMASPATVAPPPAPKPDVPLSPETAHKPAIAEPPAASPPHVKPPAAPPGRTEQTVPEAQAPPTSHPYDLDRLVQGLEAAERDLENLMGEMRQRTRPAK